MTRADGGEREINVIGRDAVVRDEPRPLAATDQHAFRGQAVTELVAAEERRVEVGKDEVGLHVGRIDG